MKTFILTLLLIIASIPLVAQSYKVIKLQGVVSVNGRALTKGSSITIKSTDQVQFKPGNAKAAIYSNSEGMVILKAKAEQQASDMIEGKVSEYFNLSKKVTGTRAGELCTALDFENRFGQQTSLVIGDALEIKVCAPSFPMNESTFFILSYNLEGEDDPIYKQLSFKDDLLFFSRSEIYQVDGQEVRLDQVSNMLLSYYDDANETEQEICPIYLVFADEAELKSELDGIVEEAKAGGAGNDLIIDTINTYLTAAYGKVDKTELETWLKANLSL